jgi:hypothetical protein
MIYVIVGNKMKPQELPCGCKTANHAKAIGLGGEVIPGCTGLNTVTGWMRLQKWVLYPALRKLLPDGRHVTTKEGMKSVHVVCPFELHCSVHGKVS